MGGCQNDGPFWVSIIIRHLLFRVSKGGHNFDNYPYGVIKSTGSARLGSKSTCAFNRLGTSKGFGLD